jgi:hypothetical protein
VVTHHAARQKRNSGKRNLRSISGLSQGYLMRWSPFDQIKGPASGKIGQKWGTQISYTVTPMGYRF